MCAKQSELVLPVQGGKQLWTSSVGGNDVWALVITDVWREREGGFLYDMKERIPEKQNGLCLDEF